MKAEVKKIDSIKREIVFELSGEKVKDKFEEVFKKLSETAKVAGFRPGHVPRDILEKNFSQHAHEMVLKELIPDLYQEAVKNEKLQVIDLPEISDVKLERNSLSFKATVDVSPEINLKNYKKIKINYQKITVSADELKRHLDSLKESRKLDNLDDGFARSIGYPNRGELEQTVEKQIYLEKENQQRRKIEEEIVETLLKDLDFKIPEALVRRQLEDLVRQAKVNLALKGAPRDKIDAQEKELAKELEPEARRQIRVYLVLSEIANKENITQDDHMPQHAMEFLLREADWQAAA